MQNAFKITIHIILLFLLLCSNSKSQTVGAVLKKETASDDLYLISPLGTYKSYLIDNCGFIYKTWTSAYPAASAAYLDPNGNLYRAGKLLNSNFNFGGGTGIIEKFDHAGSLMWTFELTNDSLQMHHDFELLPNGNILVSAWQFISNNTVVALGRNPANIGPGGFYSDVIFEIDPNNQFEIVWEWRAIDHIVQNYDNTLNNFGSLRENPHLIDINLNTTLVQQSIDWLHVNSIDYNRDLDQILISANGINEVFILDYSLNETNKGNILFRWGAMQNYNAAGAQQLFKQHDATWVYNESSFSYHLLIFNNGLIADDGQRFSTVDELILPFDSNGYMIIDENVDINKLYHNRYNGDGGNNLYSKRMGSARRNRKNNTIICESDNGRIIEADNDGDILWEYISPVSENQIAAQGEIPNGNILFSVGSYPKESYSDYFFNSWEKIEYDENSNCIDNITALNNIEENLEGVHFLHNKLCVTRSDVINVGIFNVLGERVFSKKAIKNDFCIDLNELNMGVYFVCLLFNGGQNLKTIKIYLSKP